MTSGVGADAMIVDRAWRCTMRCLECGVETAEATPACVVCGAPAPRQRRLRVKRDRAARANAPAGPGGTEDAAGWAQDPEVDGAILGERVEARKFSTTRLRPGYDVEQVDAFLNAIRDTFLGIREPSLRPDEIRNKKFSTTRLRPGYDEEEVDAFLDEAELRLAAQAGARAHASGQRSVAVDPTAGAVQIRCLECGAESAEATEVCARCGGPCQLSAVVPCTQQHTAEVFFADNAWPQAMAYPGNNAISNTAANRCEDAFGDYNRVSTSDNSIFTYDEIIPDSDSWPDGDRWLVCVAYKDTSRYPGGAPVDYSIKGSHQ
jgi:DivIVA domain-containing protein